MASEVQLKPVPKSVQYLIDRLDPNWSSGKSDGYPAWLKTNYDYATNLMVALCVRGFGSELCPGDWVSEWACFGVVTGIVGTITGNSYVLDENDFRFGDRSEVDYALFQILERAANKNLKKQMLAPAFVDTLLYLVLPAFHDMSGDEFAHSFSRSGFRSRWKYLCITGSCQSTGMVRGIQEKAGNEFFETLPAEIQHSIDRCAPMIRSQTAYICSYIKSRYHW